MKPCLVDRLFLVSFIYLFILYNWFLLLLFSFAYTHISFQMIFCCYEFWTFEYEFGGFLLMDFGSGQYTLFDDILNILSTNMRWRSFAIENFQEKKWKFGNSSNNKSHHFMCLCTHQRWLVGFFWLFFWLLLLSPLRVFSFLNFIHSAVLYPGK